MGPSTDVLAIRDVLDRYASGIDRRDFELVRSCFAAGVHADYGRGGSWTEREPFAPTPTSSRETAASGGSRGV
jgi:hypothetical protein